MVSRKWAAATVVVIVLLGTYWATNWCRSKLHEGAFAVAPDVHARYQPPVFHGHWYSKCNISDLPSWEAAVRSRPWCKTDSQLYTGRWYQTHHGEVLYEPDRCVLKRLAAPAARACLANKTIQFVGDSLSRYQYLSLAHFLSRGTYPQRYGDDPDQPNICMEMPAANGRNWTRFFERSSRQLSGSSYHISAKEQCNCHRHKIDANIYENRRLHVTMLEGGQPAGSIDMVFNFTISYPSIHGAFQRAVHYGLAHLKADIVVGNVGVWLNHGSAYTGLSADNLTQMWDPIFALAKTLQLGRAPIAIWRTISDGGYRPAVTVTSKVLTSVARARGWRVLDSEYVTLQAKAQGVAMRWDHAHYLPAMYDQWNDLLLHQLCSVR
jgi:hypothetical protein